MVMGRRPDVRTAPPQIATFTVTGLAEQLLTSLATVPFRHPWDGPSGTVENIGQAVTRRVVRTLMGYATGLPTEEYRSLEVVLDDICRVVLTPIVHRMGVETRADTVGGVPGIWYQVKDHEPRGTILYLHGGGYIGTSPSMYAAFTGWIARKTDCRVFVADYRLAPEFPFPAGLLDALGALEALYDDGVDPARLFLAGDSGGGGLATSVLLDGGAHHLPRPAGLLLFSPEVDLTLDEPSVTDNADLDILPWNIPTVPYLHGVDPKNRYVSTVNADLHGFPPTFLAFGDEEMFRDPIRRFVDRLHEADIESVVIEEPKMFHVYPILMPWAAAAQRTYVEAGHFVKAHLPPD